MAKSKFTFFVASEHVVVGTNYEMADMDNPNGEIVRERFYMVAEDASGNRRRFGREETEFGAEIAFQHFAPAVSEWLEMRPAYGSDAYLSYGSVEDRIDEMEADLGPDWMNHSQVSLKFAPSFSKDIMELEIENPFMRLIPEQFKTMTPEMKALLKETFKDTEFDCPECGGDTIPFTLTEGVCFQCKHVAPLDECNYETTEEEEE